MRYVAIRSEGGLIPYDLLDKIASDDAAGQKPGDFGLPKGRRLSDEISRVWADAQSLWSNFKRRRESLGDRDPYGTSITRSWIGSLLGDVDMLGFDLKLQASAVVVNNSTYAISHRSGEGEDAIPVHIEGLKIDLDRRLHTKLRTSPQAMLQDFLNNGEQVLWGIVTNGLGLRILRDSSRTARPTYLEFDLESILEGNRFNEFALLYRVCHRSRFPRPGQEPSDCLLERYYQDSVEQGLRVRDKLREGVEETLKILGTGFLQHPANDVLREKVSSGQLTAIQFHRQLLLLVYRLLFLMVAEERGLIVSVGENAEPNQRIYDEWYSITRLRDRAAQIIDTSPFGDVWQGLQQTFSLFEYGLDTNPLGIPPLNGDLFHQEHAIPNLKGTELFNHELLRAIRHLSLFKDGNIQQRVNYSALDVEELGSVYESLLDYQPVLQPSDKGLVFELRTGMERKSTGSYYTRPELVHELVERALVPVMEDRISAAEKASEGKNLVEEQKAKIAAILSMTVCDPACGSGHFLLAAARRLGKELARVKTGEDEPRPEDFHLAVREVISQCVYGVDLNPLAVDLCKLALWLEGHWAGKPLSFLDHRIRCGNSLVGVLDPDVMADGIPDDAFSAITGDEKKIAATFKKRNKQERLSKQHGFSFDHEVHADDLANAKRELAKISDDTAAAVRRKAELYGTWRAGMQQSHHEAVADLWTAQFFHVLNNHDAPAICTSGPFLDFAKIAGKQPQRVAAAQAQSIQNQFFHWRFEFPEVFENGGFDVLLGNPPWEAVQTNEVAFLESAGVPDVASLPGARRKAATAELMTSRPELAQDWERYARKIETVAKFARHSGRYPLTATGKLNTYALFAELSRQLLLKSGRLGILVPTGIATDDGTKVFFGKLISDKALVSLVGFENEAFIFPAVHHSFRFCALTVGGSDRKASVAKFVFFCRHFEDVNRVEKWFELSATDLAQVNPNSHTCPIFRSSVDAELTKKIYRHLPVILKEAPEANPWDLEYRQGLFNMTTDSELFERASRSDRLPLYEAKMIHQFDHRFATYDGASQANLNSGILPQTTQHQKRDPEFSVVPRYWVSRSEVDKQLDSWKHDWYLAFRDVTSAIVERTAIFAVLPRVAAGHTCCLSLLRNASAEQTLLFLANVNSMIFDYTTRQKLGGNHLTLTVLSQLPAVPPNGYSPSDIEFIAPRALELTYTASDLTSFAEEVGYRGSVFEWDDQRREQLIVELDAYYAHLYGLTRDEFIYVLDPKEVFGEDFPSETFRVLKEREIKECGEYRTQRLVLEAYDKLAKSDRFRDEVPKRVSSLVLPNKAASITGGNCA